MRKSLVALAALAVFFTGCGSSGSGTASAQTPSAGGASSATSPSGAGTAPVPSHQTVHQTPTPTAATGTNDCTVPSPTPAPKGTGENQWAKHATATSNYGNNRCDNWNASQAEGAPNATCSDDSHAWATSDKAGIETLTLTFVDKVIPSRVRVVESFNPGRVSKVVVSGNGQSKQVYSSPSDAAGGGVCVTLDIPITDVAFAVDTVAVTVDQTNLNSWAEIDAVELVGTTI